MTAEIPPNNAIVNRVLVPLIVAGCVAMVLVPSIVAYLPVERSKWRLASALSLLEENERDKASEADKSKRRSQAEKYLNESETINPNITANQDYVRVYWALYPKDIEHVAILISKQSERIEKINSVSLIIATLFEHKEYDSILKIIDMVFPKIEDREPELNNSWAYAASLSDTRLEEAEKAVNEALKHNTNFAYQDTKAWVLHRLGRNEEALVEAQKSIQEHLLQSERFYQRQFLALDPIMQELKNFDTAFCDSDPLGKIKPEDLLAKLKAVDDGTNESVKDLRDKLQNQTPPSPPKSLLEKSPKAVHSVKQAFVVLRYHRTEIIRGLGLTRIADWEWEAINKAGFNDPGDLE